MARILVAYATSEGQTEKIAHRIADWMGRHGHQVVLTDVREPDARSVTDRFDAAVIAGSVHYSRHDKVLTDFVHRHQPRLTEAPSAFISVSLAASSDKPKDQAGVRRWAKDFYDKSGWTPDAEYCAAGAIRDSRLGFFKRMLVHWILRKEDITLDPSGDTEFTDWAKLDAFVEAFLAKAGVGE